MGKNKEFLNNWIVLVSLALLLFFALSFVFNYFKSPVDPKGKQQAFVIARGEGTNSIAQRLQEEGLIRSGLAFKIELQLSGKKGQIEAGDFKISPSMTTEEIINVLSQGSIDKWVTLIEGWRIEEIAQELNSKVKIQKAKFIELAKPYEGYLFPDTYLFNPESDVETIINIMRENFNKKYSQDLQKKIKNKGLTLEQGVILASLVEREARSDKVRTEVAGILLKRLKMGMKLDVDSTVQYAKDSIAMQNGKNLDKFWKPITKADYKSVVHPYNTYLNNGLPPGPICNPSLSSLNAVANADPNTPYLYYYHDSSGNSYYARTLEEHLKNVASNP